MSFCKQAMLQGVQVVWLGGYLKLYYKGLVYLDGAHLWAGFSGHTYQAGSWTGFMKIKDAETIAKNAVEDLNV